MTESADNAMNDRGRSRRRWWWLTWLSALLLVGVLSWYVHSHWEEFSRLRIVDPLDIGLLALLIALRLTIRGVFQWQTLRALGANLGMIEALRLCFAGVMLNQLLPLPVGVGYRAAYMRRFHQFPYEYFASTMAALFVFFMLASSGLGLAAMGWLASRGTPVRLPAAALLAGVFFATLSTFFLPKSISGTGPIARRLTRFLDGWRIISRSPRLLIGAAGVVVTSILISMAAMFVAFGAFGTRIDVPGTLLLMSSQRVGSLVKLTPGAIGYQELVSVYFTTMLAVTTAEAVVALGLARLISILVGATLGLPSLWLIGHSRRARTETTLET